LSSLFGGTGRLRIGFSELDPPPGEEPDDDQIQAAVRACWDNQYCAFDGLAGTSLVCIQGDWSNVVDGKIKGHLSALANRDLTESPYNPLYARASHTPRPWGVTAVLAEYTGNHPALDIDWSAEKIASVRVNPTVIDVLPPRDVMPIDHAAPSGDPAPAPLFETFWDFARALNRSDPEALRLASNGAEGVTFMDGPALRKLVGTFWFRSVFARLSSAWQEHLLSALVEHAPISNHAVRSDRRTVRLNELTQEQRRRLVTEPSLPEAVRSDLQFLVTVAILWGEDAVNRFTFTDVMEAADSSRFALLLQPFRHS